MQGMRPRRRQDRSGVGRGSPTGTWSRLAPIAKHKKVLYGAKYIIVVVPSCLYSSARFCVRFVCDVRGSVGVGRGLGGEGGRWVGGYECGSSPSRRIRPVQFVPTIVIDQLS